MLKAEKCLMSNIIGWLPVCVSVGCVRRFHSDEVLNLRKPIAKRLYRDFVVHLRK